MKSILLALAAVSLLVSMKTDKPAYFLFDSKGKKASYNDLIDQASNVDVVLFGELHNNPICHWLQLELTSDLYKLRKDKLVLGAEMFEADDQAVLDEYLNGMIKESNFKKEVKLWPNYETDYRPLVELARENKLPFVATNVPRRYAALVNTSGFEGLEKISAEQQKYIAPAGFPYDPELPGYKKMLQTDQGMQHRSGNLPKAQALKDATMAYFIAKHAGEGKLFLHFNGSYHSDNHEGLVWYLKHYGHSLKVLTIASVEMADISQLPEDSLGLGDFILLVPESMTKTY